MSVRNGEVLGCEETSMTEHSEVEWELPPTKEAQVERSYKAAVTGGGQRRSVVPPVSAPPKKLGRLLPLEEVDPALWSWFAVSFQTMSLPSPPFFFLLVSGRGGGVTKCPGEDKNKCTTTFLGGLWGLSVG